jgi:hypothetical protein
MQGLAEPVATYPRWHILGRQVIRGSKAAVILRPMMARSRAATADEDEPARLVGFKAVNCIFGVSQTAGEPLPPVDPPTWSLEGAVAALGVKRVRFELLEGNTQGYSIGKEYAISPVAVDPTRTTFHELAHIVLGHTVEPQPNHLARRRVEEFQAEATAYLCLKETDLLTAESACHSRGYIQSWLGGRRPSDQAIRAVFGATDSILRAGRARPEGQRSDP